ncbi:hypothetical protein J2S34_003726 [Nitrobacter winogradskyi]|uniref:Uncharacterized protein n=1 Tax=Nitrobacter winogradskyi TaxID=913 RepID=A0ACC6AQP7_NITWI|nr:hypothetical protein [Nitrobacter winogradskyi]MCP2001240.1 hypothetical protein [Nitrobacter winogradskyi]
MSLSQIIPGILMMPSAQDRIVDNASARPMLNQALAGSRLRQEQLFWGVIASIKLCTSQGCSLSVKLPDWYSRRAANRGERGHVAHHTATRRDARAGSNHDMIRYRCLSSNHNVVTEDSAASNADLSRYHAGDTDSYIMTNLHQVIDHSARTNDGVAERASVDCSVSTDFDIVSNHDATKLRCADWPTRSWTKPETGCANSRARKDFHTIAYERVAN